MNSYPDLAREHMEKSISLLDQFNLLHINDSIPQIANYATIYLMTANLPQTKTHFKRAFKIYEKIWADEPEMIKAKFQEIQELNPQIGFSIGKTLSGLLTK